MRCGAEVCASRRAGYESHGLNRNWASQRAERMLSVSAHDVVRVVLTLQGRIHITRDPASEPSGLACFCFVSLKGVPSGRRYSRRRSLCIPPCHSSAEQSVSSTAVTLNNAWLRWCLTQKDVFHLWLLPSRLTWTCLHSVSFSVTSSSHSQVERFADVVSWSGSCA